MFYALSSTKDYIRAKGNFHKQICNWKDQLGRNKNGKPKWEKGELSRDFMEWNTVERAIKTETDTGTE